MAYETISVSTNDKWRDVEEVRPAVNIQLADALAKQAEVSSQAAKAAEHYLIARDEWNYQKAQLERIGQDVARLREESESR